MDKGAMLLIFGAIGILAILINAAQKPRRPRGHRMLRQDSGQQKAESRQFTLILGGVALLVGVPLFLHYVLGWHV